MKAKFSYEIKEFKPRTIEITIESQDEMDFIRNLFAWNPVYVAMENTTGSKPDCIIDAIDNVTNKIGNRFNEIAYILNRTAGVE